MRTVIAIPPMRRMTGGIVVLYQIARCLAESGRDVALCAEPEAPGLASQAQDIPHIPWQDAARALTRQDLFLIAEGWSSMLAPALKAGCISLVYAQNWAYVFSALPPGVSWSALGVRFLAVSDPVARFVAEMARLPLAGIVRPAIDRDRYRAGTKPGNRVRIGWMPRKNKALADQIRQISEASLAASGGPRTEWVEIHNMSPDQVAATLATCHIFLATGFPEGCPLPPLEAMASGCVVVGFSGFGGWDYMRQAPGGLFCPRISLRPVPWQGNGLFASDGDVMEAAHLLHQAVNLIGTDGHHHILVQGQATAAAYSNQAQAEAIARIWDELET